MTWGRIQPDLLGKVHWNEWGISISCGACADTCGLNSNLELSCRLSSESEEIMRLRCLFPFLSLCLSAQRRSVAGVSKLVVTCPFLSLYSLHGLGHVIQDFPKIHPGFLIWMGQPASQMPVCHPFPPVSVFQIEPGLPPLLPHK